MNSRHVKRIASPQANWGQRAAYFALAVERRLWRGLRSFPGRPAYGRFPPNCDVHESGRLRPLYVDSGRPLSANTRSFAGDVASDFYRLKSEGPAALRIDHL
jgi:hypothetical protein